MKGWCVWFTGLPGSGKTTSALALADALMDMRYSPVILDGDEVRTWLTPDLGFSKIDRRMNVLRVAGVAKKIVEACGVVIVSLVSPYDTDREDALGLIGRDRTLLVYLCGRNSPQLWEGTEYEIPTSVEHQITLNTLEKETEERTREIIKVLESMMLIFQRQGVL